MNDDENQEMTQERGIISKQTRAMRGRPVTQEEAQAALQRLINSMFNQKPGGRASIPVRVDDDDVLLRDYIAELESALAEARAWAEAAERERNIREERDYYRILAERAERKERSHGQLQ